MSLFKLFGQEFEYYSTKSINPNNSDFEKHPYGSKEYKNLEISAEYSKLMLNALGELGWELISVIPDPFGEGETIAVSKFVFKRSSWSKHYGTGIAVDLGYIGELARKKVMPNP